MYAYVHREENQSEPREMLGCGKGKGVKWREKRKERGFAEREGVNVMRTTFFFTWGHISHTFTQEAYQKEKSNFQHKKKT